MELEGTYQTSGPRQSRPLYHSWPPPALHFGCGAIAPGITGKARVGRRAFHKTPQTSKIAFQKNTRNYKKLETHQK